MEINKVRTNIQHQRLSKTVPQVHLHVWSENMDDDLVYDADVEMTGEYDDHYQFSIMVEGRLVEIRVAK